MKKTILALLTAGALLTGILSGCAAPGEPSATEGTTPPEEDPKTITLHLITEARSYRDGKPLERTQATYDQRGLTQTIIHEDFSIPKQSYHHVYHYNDHGHLLYTSTMENGQEVAKSAPFDYHYNTDGSLSSIDGYYDNSSVALQYNGQGQLEKVTTTYFDGKLWFHSSCKYNNAGLLEEYHADYKDKLTGAATYSTTNRFQYNDQGRLIGVDYPISYSCEYDEYGNLIRENDRYFTYSAPDGVIIHMQDTQNSATRYFYDELGRLVRMENGDYHKEWDYQTIEVPIENKSMAIVFYNSVNEPAGIEYFYDKIINYLLPRANYIF